MHENIDKCSFKCVACTHRVSAVTLNGFFSTVQTKAGQRRHVELPKHEWQSCLSVGATIPAAATCGPLMGKRNLLTGLVEWILEYLWNIFQSVLQTPQSLKRGLQKVDHYLDFHDFSWSVFTVSFWPQAAWHLLCIKVLAKILLSAHTYILYRLVKVTSPLCSKAKCGLQCCQCAVSTFKVAATAHASLSVNSWMNYRGTSAPVCTIELLH